MLKRLLTMVYFNVKCVIFVILIVSSCECQELSSTCEENRNGTGTVFLACFSEPQLLPGTENVTITIEPENMTCGTPPGYFRPLGYQSEVDKCDNNMDDKSHPPEFIIDDDAAGTWWQSNTWPIDMVLPDAPEVTIHLTFGKLYELAGDLKIIFNSGRPKKMTIEKSRDNGRTWKIWQVYAQTDCSGYPTTLTKDDPARVVCTRQYSQTYPTSGGKVLFKADDRYILFLGNDLSNYPAFYDALDNTDLQQFLTFSDIRIKLSYPATDEREMFRNEQDFIRYYYAISDIEIVARCFCYQHASICYDGPSGTTICQCKHNTDGINCETCMPLFNNRPWRPGSYHPFPSGTANECTQCECNDHADSCTYSEVYGRGICDDCQHNTTGQNCEQCVAGFFRNTSLELNSTDVCIDCSCEMLGTQNSDNSCSQRATLFKPIGQCVCNPLVGERRCDLCVKGFYGLLLEDSLGVCKVCQCEQYGTLGNSNNCDQVDGQCPCKASTTGRSCGQCKEGYYNFPTGFPKDECVFCACDPGGSRSPLCNEHDGSCLCRPHIHGTKCTNVDAGYYVPPIDEQVFQPTAGSPQCRVDGEKLTDENPFDGESIATCNTPAQVEFESVTLGPQKAVAWPYFSGVRFTLNSSSLVDINATLSITVVGDSNTNLTSIEKLMNTTLNPSCPEIAGSVRNMTGVLTPDVGAFALFGESSVPFDTRCIYSFSLDIEGPADSVVLDSVVILPDLQGLSQHNNSTSQDMFELYNRSEDPTTLIADYKNCLTNLVALSTRKTSRNSLICGSMAFAISTELYNGAIPCDCDPVGMVSGGALICEATGGQCPCKVGIGGRHCDRCIPGYYLLSDTGCTACDCQEDGSWNGACDQTTGQCSCLPNIAEAGQDTRYDTPADRKCSACVRDYWVSGNSSGCMPCSCSDVGANGTLCDESGQCSCKLTIDGPRCEKCEMGYYNFSADGCKKCNCTVEGSAVDGCGEETGSCTCKENVEGDSCELCKQGYFSLSATNPDGCRPCFCYGHGTECTSADGFKENSIFAESSSTWARVNGSYVQAPANFLGNQLYAYGNSVVFYLRSTETHVTAMETVAVLIEGNDGLQIYSEPANMTIESIVYSRVEILFHHNYWHINESTIPQPLEMYKLMANLKNLYIRFLYDTMVVDITNITVTTAELISDTGKPGTVYVTGVEKCVCNPDDSVNGNSCEICATGNRRIGYDNGTLYDKCEACDCTERGETTPPECDEISGICLNCRNGTLGDYCELCAPHVVGDDCTECNDTYWGMTADGCKECNCSEPGTQNNVCDKDGGQCVCALNIADRICDVCEESFYNLTDTGCIACPECYSLVMNVVNDLRFARDNLTKYLETVEKQRNNDTQPFLERLQATAVEFQDLLTFLSQIADNQGNLWNKLNPLKDSTDILADTLRNDTIPVAELAHNSITTMGSLFEDMAGFQVQINSAANQVGQLEMGPVSEIAAAMTDLVADLQTVYDTITALAGNAIIDLKNLENTVGTIENTTTQAIKDAENALQSVQNTQIQHQDTTRMISNMENQDVQLTGSIQGILAATSAQNTSTSRIKSTMDTIEANLNSLSEGTTDLDQLRNRAMSQKQEANTLSLQATTESSSSKGTVARVTGAVDKTKELLNDLQIVRNQSTRADDQALAAKQTSDASSMRINDAFRKAEDMLETMQHFESRATEVETQANMYLNEAEATMNTSQATIDKAKSLRESLSQTQRNSALSTEAAQQGQAYVQLDLTSLQPVAEKADQLRNSTHNLLQDIESASHIPDVSNMTILDTLDQCIAQEQTLNNLTEDADSTKTEVSEISDAIDNTQQRAARVLNDIQNIAQLDVPEIMALQSQVIKLRQDFTKSQLVSTIQMLQQELADQQSSLEIMRTRKMQIEQGLEKLRKLRSNILS